MTPEAGVFVLRGLDLPLVIRAPRLQDRLASVPRPRVLKPGQSLRQRRLLDLRVVPGPAFRLLIPPPGGPALKPMRQRSDTLSSNHEAAGCSSTCVRLASSRSRALFVSSGSLPFWGSTIHPEIVVGTNVSACFRSTASCSRLAASSSVRNSWLTSSSGLSKGVMVLKSQIPWRSGSPHAVFKASFWAAAGATPMGAITDRTPTTQSDAATWWFISTPTNGILRRESS